MPKATSLGSAKRSGEPTAKPASPTSHVALTEPHRKQLVALLLRDGEAGVEAAFGASRFGLLKAAAGLPLSRAIAFLITAKLDELRSAGGK